MVSSPGGSSLGLPGCCLLHQSCQQAAKLLHALKQHSWSVIATFEIMGRVSSSSAWLAPDSWPRAKGLASAWLTRPYTPSLHLDRASVCAAVESYALNKGLKRVPGPDKHYQDICFGGAPSHEDIEALSKVFPSMEIQFDQVCTPTHLTTAPLCRLPHGWFMGGWASWLAS